MLSSHWTVLPPSVVAVIAAQQAPYPLAAVIAATTAQAPPLNQCLQLVPCMPTPSYATRLGSPDCTSTC